MSSDGARGRSGVAGGTRAFNNALRGVGKGPGGDERMDLDTGVGRARHKRTGARSAGPLDQSGRRSKDTPYDKPNGSNKALSSRISGLNPPTAGPSSKKKGRGPSDPRRAPEGTPDLIRNDNRKGALVRQQRQNSKINAVLKGPEIKEWLRSRSPAPGVLDFSRLGEDPWLKERGIIPPGDPDAPQNAGMVFWSLARDLDRPEQRIHTLSLSDNGFTNLNQLSRLPLSLPHIRALNLENNPINRSDELRHLQSAGEQKGKASAAAGSLKALVEIKLNGCKFREQMLQQPGGAAKYRHDVLRRFPGLLILDGEELDRIVFPLQRQAIVRRTEEDRKQLAAKPFTYPFEVKPSFSESEECRVLVAAFCEKFFFLWDQSRSQVIDGYHPNATISLSANTLPSRSHQAKEIAAQIGKSRPPPTSFEPYVNLPGRNFFRSCTTVEQRMSTLKTPQDRLALERWLQAVPASSSPLSDGGKWCIDSWYIGENNARICAVVQGEFTETTKTTRSFTRTFILAAAEDGTPAKMNNWPCCILSDITVVHSYLGTASFDGRAPLAQSDVAIVPPGPPVAVAAAAVAPGAGGDGGVPGQAALVDQVRGRTGMNAQFSAMCLEQNGWDVERAVANFQEIRETIPPEAYV